MSHFLRLVCCLINKLVKSVHIKSKKNHEMFFLKNGFLTNIGLKLSKMYLITKNFFSGKIYMKVLFQKGMNHFWGSFVAWESSQQKNDLKNLKILKKFGQKIKVTLERNPSYSHNIWPLRNIKYVLKRSCSVLSRYASQCFCFTGGL